jgi:hypothetical protein
MHRIHQATRLAARPGFGPLEIIVLLAVVATVGAVALPVVVQANRLDRMNETAEILADVQVSLYNTSNTPVAFRQDVAQNAGRLTQLNTAITSSDPNSCTGHTFGNPQVKNWEGPYGRHVIDGTVGLVTPIGFGDNDLVRIDSGTTHRLAINFPDVDLADVAVLDGLADTGDGSQSGSIRWTTAGATTTFQYSFLIDASC